MSAEVSTPSLRVEAPIIEPSEVDADLLVHPAGAHQKPTFRWGYFLLLNGIAGVIAVALFVGIGRAESLDPYMAATYEWLLAHPMATSVMAFSPLVSCGLVGWGYSQRARKRKAAAAAALALSASKGEGAALAPSAAEPVVPVEA